MLLLSVYGEHINQVTDGYAAASASKANAARVTLNNNANAGMSSLGGHTSEYRGKLNDAEEFVRVMLQVNASSAATTTSTTAVDTRSQSYGGDLRESFSSTSSRPGQGTQGAGQNRLNPATGGPVVRRLFAEEASQRSFGHGNGNSGSMSGTNTSGNNTRNNTVSRSSFAPPSPTNVGGEGCCEPPPQLLRSPPPGYKPDFDA